MQEAHLPGFSLLEEGYFETLCCNEGPELHEFPAASQRSADGLYLFHILIMEYNTPGIFIQVLSNFCIKETIIVTLKLV